MKPALPNEDPVLIQGPLPQNRRYPCRKLPAPLQVAPFARESAVLPYPLVGWFDLVSMVSPKPFLAWALLLPGEEWGAHPRW